MTTQTAAGERGLNLTPLAVPVQSAVRRIKHMRYLRELIRHYGANQAYQLFCDARTSEKEMSLEARRRALLRPMTLDSEMEAIAQDFNQQEVRHDA